MTIYTNLSYAQAMTFGRCTFSPSSEEVHADWELDLSEPQPGDTVVWVCRDDVPLDQRIRRAEAQASGFVDGVRRWLGYEIPGGRVAVAPDNPVLDRSSEYVEKMLTRDEIPYDGTHVKLLWGHDDPTARLVVRFLPARFGIPKPSFRAGSGRHYALPASSRPQYETLIPKWTPDFDEAESSRLLGRQRAHRRGFEIAEDDLDAIAQLMESVSH